QAPRHRRGPRQHGAVPRLRGGRVDHGPDLPRQRRLLLLHVSGPAIEIGLALWTMQSTAGAPASHSALYRHLPDDARLVEALGFDSMWFAEHRFWYDGWCPAPLVAAASAASATTSLGIGTSMVLLPPHDAR